MKKTRLVTHRVEEELFQQFKAAAAKRKQPMSRIFSDFMRQYKATVNYNEYINSILTPPQ